MNRIHIYRHKPPTGPKYLSVIVTNEKKLVFDLAKRGIAEVWIWRNFAALVACITTQSKQ